MDLNKNLNGPHSEILWKLLLLESRGFLYTEHTPFKSFQQGVQGSLLQVEDICPINEMSVIDFTPETNPCNIVKEKKIQCTKSTFHNTPSFYILQMFCVLKFSAGFH